MMTLNEAIFQVLTAEYKKDAAEAFAIVKAAGYEIEKRDVKQYAVRNKETGRILWIEYRTKWNSKAYRDLHITIVHHGTSYYNVSQFIDKSPLAAGFNFEACLNKPLNRTYYNMKTNYYDKSLAHAKYEELKSARWNVKYEVEKIKNIQKQLEDLQKELIRRTENKVKAEQRLVAKQKELHLA